MIITIGGSIASGKTTLAKELSKQLGFEHISAGGIMRDMAEEQEMSLSEFSKHAEKNFKIDREIDKRQKELAKGNCVVDGRLSSHFLDSNLKIWLVSPVDVRVRRVAGRDGCSPDEALNEIVSREKSEQKRYKKLYNIDLNGLEKYDIILNTDRWDIKGITDVVLLAISRLI